MANLITAQEVIELAFAENSNMREESISDTSIRIAEIKYIKPVFGNMYSMLGTTYSDFTNEYIKPALAYFVKCEIVSSIAIDMSNSGIALANPQYQSAASDKQRQRLYDSEMSKAKVLLDDALAYISAYKEDFPDFGGIAPKKHYRNGGLILGGGVPAKSEQISADAVSRKEFNSLAKDVENLQSEIENYSAVTLIPITYSELKELKLSGTLSAGVFYRITDYECSTTQANTRCANHPFDIIVQALDNHTLSELAHAIAREDDTYFALANLNAWRLKYTLENDTTKHSWAKVEVLEKPALWSSDWGVLEERYDNGDSSNYEIATVDGKRIFLYRPTNPTSFLDGLSFVRKVTSGTVTTPNGFIYEADSAPYEDGSEEEGYSWNWSDVYEIRVKTASGKYVATLYHDTDGTYYDSNDSDNMWPITFDPNAKWSDNEVYLFTPDGGVEDWWQEIMGGVFGEVSYEPYTGPINSLYYAFDNPLYKGTTLSVKMLSDKQHVYFINEDEDYFDTVAYSAYVAHEEGGKGVIYEMIDEHGNHCPFDFKNMQFLHEGEWYYTFSFKGADLSLTDYCADNYIYTNKNTKWDDTTTPVPNAIPMLVFNAKANASGKTIGITHNCLNVSVAKGYISATRIENLRWGPRMGGDVAVVGNLYINLSGVLYGNTISGAATEFTVGSNSTPAVAFYDNEIHLPTYRRGIFKCNCSTFVSNVLNLTEASSGFTITSGSITSCHIECSNYESSDRSDTIAFGANVVLRNSIIKIYEDLSINYANTTSTTAPLRFLNIDARGWSDSAITIPSTFQTNARYELKVAKNSSGEIKMWCEADLAN